MIDLLKVIGRVYTILPLMLFAALFMGKRSIGELPVFDFLVVITLGSLVGADIAEPNVNHIHTSAAVLAIALLQKIVSYWKIKSRKVGKWLTFEPTVVIFEGQFLVDNMKKIQYSIDNVLQMLRENNMFSVKDVEIAIVEANGKLTVKPYLNKEVARVEHLNSEPKDGGIEFPVIIDGIINRNVLEQQHLNEAWLREELLKSGVANINDVFYAAVNKANKLHVSVKKPKSLEVPTFEH
ncbi:DUF421 domain-containing protein [Bacillus timonensis]|nr:DUF421 domain-containing protein [Bacillus timonensis]